jgi:hypothetical protein
VSYEFDILELSKFNPLDAPLYSKALIDGVLGSVYAANAQLMIVKSLYIPKPQQDWCGAGLSSAQVVHAHSRTHGIRARQLLLRLRQRCSCFTFQLFLRRGLLVLDW